MSDNPLPESDSADFGPTAFEVRELLRDYARANGYRGVVLLGKRPGEPMKPLLVVDLRDGGQETV